jgi:two-component system, LytTR family, sensor kinase
MNLFARATFKASFAAVLLILAVAHAYLLWQGNYASAAAAIVEATCSAILLFFLCYVQSSILSYYAPTKQRQLFIIGWSFLLASAWVAATYFCTSTYFSDAEYSNMYKRTMLLRVLVGTIFISAVGLYNLLWESLKFETQMRERESSLAQMANEAELYKLRQQIQPHFLFNSLNSINALVGTAPQEARNMVLKLSDFLRATLKREEKELITLQEELSYISMYLDIEKVRFGERLAITYNLHDAALTCTLPNLLLQPLIENAIKFGLYNTIDVALVSIDAFVKDSKLHIKVHNNADDNSSTDHSGTGFGLASTARRLELVYGTAKLVQASNTDNTFTVYLQLPQ